MLQASSLCQYRVIVRRLRVKNPTRWAKTKWLLPHRACSNLPAQQTAEEAVSEQHLSSSAIRTVPVDSLLKHIHPNVVAAAQSLPPSTFVYPQIEKPSKVNTMMKGTGIVLVTSMVPGFPLMNSIIYHFLPKREKFSSYITLPRQLICDHTRAGRFSRVFRWSVCLASLFLCLVFSEISMNIYGKEKIQSEKTMAQILFFETEADKDMTVKRLSAQVIPEHSNYWLLRERPIFTSMCVFLGPLTEEVFYRGMVFGHLLQGGMPFLPAALFSATVFSVPHMVQEFQRGTSPEYMYHMGTITFFNGVVWAGAYWLTGNIWVPLFSHMAVNVRALWKELDISLTR